MPSVSRHFNRRSSNEMDEFQILIIPNTESPLCFKATLYDPSFETNPSGGFDDLRDQTQFHQRTTDSVLAPVWDFNWKIRHENGKFDTLFPFETNDGKFPGFKKWEVSSDFLNWTLFW